MRIGEVISVSGKLAEDYDDEQLFRLTSRVTQRATETKTVEEAAMSIVSEEIKSKELVPTLKEGYKLLKTLLVLQKQK